MDQIQSNNYTKSCLTFLLSSQYPCRQYNDLLGLVQELYLLGFRVISHAPNLVTGADGDGFYHYVEVVFMREN